MDGRTSTGVAICDKHPCYWHRADEIDSIAAAVAALKTHHESTRVMMVGMVAGGRISSDSVRVGDRLSPSNGRQLKTYRATNAKAQLSYRVLPRRVGSIGSSKNNG